MQIVSVGSLDLMTTGREGEPRVGLEFEPSRASSARLAIACFVNELARLDSTRYYNELKPKIGSTCITRELARLAC